MLESLYSKRVVQPYLMKEFPLSSKEAHDDRLFKHITFFEDDPTGVYRLSAVDHNNRVLRQSSESIQKTVQTNVEITDSEKEIFRVKAVLSEPDHGQTESFWVTQKTIDPSTASSHNQYRVRGVTDKGWRSDWVYSELRDNENDLIVYNMLYDVLDLLLTVHDDEVDYLIDYMVSDVFAQILKESRLHYVSQLDIEESKMTFVEEILSMLLDKESISPEEEFVAKLGESFSALATDMKQEFTETLFRTPHEFAELLRSYNVIDQYKENNKDFLQLLVEVFIDDSYEKLVQKTDIEVLLQKDEEMGIYLNGTYKFDIKNELINSLYDASPSDRFVTNLDDAVQLIIDPVVTEELMYGEREVVEKFLRIAMTELYAPMQAIDQHLLELSVDLEDIDLIEYDDSVLEMSTFDKDGYELRHMLVSDMIEAVIKGDLEPIDDYHMELIDHVLQSSVDSRKSVLIDYYFDEVLQVTADVGESFRQAYTKAFFEPEEDKQVGLKDHTALMSITHNHPSIKESFYAKLEDTHDIFIKKDFNDFHEKKEVSLLDSIISQYNLFKETVQESIHIVTKDKTSSNSLTELAILNEFQKTGLQDFTSLSPTVIEETENESIVVIPEDYYYNLFKHYLRQPNKFPLLDHKIVDLRHDLRDAFIMDGTDLVQYALGDMDDGWPTGAFRLGVNTLKGEVSSS